MQDSSGVHTDAVTTSWYHQCSRKSHHTESCRGLLMHSPIIFFDSWFHSRLEESRCPADTSWPLSVTAKFAMSFGV